MEREPGEGSLFFRGLQNRSQEKMKLRKRKSALYLSPQKSTRRSGGKGVGRPERSGGGKSQTPSESSICWVGLPRKRSELETGFSVSISGVCKQCILPYFMLPSQQRGEASRQDVAISVLRRGHSGQKLPKV